MHAHARTHSRDGRPRAAEAAAVAGCQPRQSSPSQAVFAEQAYTPAEMRAANGPLSARGAACTFLVVRCRCRKPPAPWSLRCCGRRIRPKAPARPATRALRACTRGEPLPARAETRSLRSAWSRCLRLRGRRMVALRHATPHGPLAPWTSARSRACSLGVGMPDASKGSPDGGRAGVESR